MYFYLTKQISKGDKRLPKALDKEALDKLKALNFEDLEEEMETARDIFLLCLLYRVLLIVI